MATDANTQTTNNNEEQPKEQKVTFNDEQQARINELIVEAQGRAGREAREKAAKLQKDLEALTAKYEATAPKENSEGNGNTQKAEPDWKAENQRIRKEFETETALAKRLAAEEVAKRENLEKSLKQRDKTDAIRTAMDSLDVEFVSRNSAVKLTEDNVVWDDERKRFVVHDEKGNLRFNAALDPMTLDEYYQSFVNQNQWLVRAKVRGGAGSKESNSNSGGKFKLEDLFGANSKAALANQLAKDNIGEYRRMRALAKESGLI